MNRSANEKALSTLLFIQAGILACALPAVVTPTDWMDAVHKALGMGPLPRAPLVEYLTRSLSLLYAAWAPFFVLMALETKRYLPMVRLMGWLLLTGPAVLLPLDLWAGLPVSWVMSEVLSLLVQGAATLWLESRARKEEGTKQTGERADALTPDGPTGGITS